MSENIKHVLDDSELNSLSIKHFCHNKTNLLDLSDEILLFVCRYLSPAYVLYSFYTPSTPEMRLHRVISDYYKKMKLDRITNDEYNYLSNLFYYLNFPLEIESLILSNEHINCLIQRYFISKPKNLIQSMFSNLKYLKIILFSTENLAYIHSYDINMEHLQYLHISIHKIHKKSDMDFTETSSVSINRLLFGKKMSSIDTVFMEIHSGLVLNKSLISHQNLRHVNLVLQTIDDLFILLDGLVPNVKTMIIQLCQQRILSCNPPKNTSTCSQLTEFQLFEPRIGFVIDDIKSIFIYMTNLIKLTLSIRDTPDPIFCQGHKFELILNEYLPNLRYFDYTITHRIIDQFLIEDFIRWPMETVFYSNENCKWIHIYSLPWPQNKDDKRRLPIIKTECNTSVTSNVKRSKYMDHIIITKQDQLFQLKTLFRRVSKITTALSINIELPLRIYKLILSEETNISSINSIIQPSIRHLIVKHRLSNVDEMSILSRQFPHVNYLELLFPSDKSLFIIFLKILFNRDDNIKNQYKFWSELIHFSTELNSNQLNSICSNDKFYDWLMENTDLKYYKNSFYVHFSFSNISIWF